MSDIIKKDKPTLADTYKIDFTNEQIEIIKKAIAKGATDEELKMFLEMCRATGLNPFMKEIFFAKYFNKKEGREEILMMTSRDGYLKIANNHPQFDGIESGVERDKDGKPIYGWARVWRKDRKHPVYCEAYFDEYYKKGHPTWEKYKGAMIQKVAESMALKRAFAVSGLVSVEEMGYDNKQYFEAEYEVIKENEAKELDEETKNMIEYIEKNTTDEEKKRVEKYYKISFWKNLDKNILKKWYEKLKQKKGEEKNGLEVSEKEQKETKKIEEAKGEAENNNMAKGEVGNANETTGKRIDKETGEIIEEENYDNGIKKRKEIEEKINALLSKGKSLEEVVLEIFKEYKINMLDGIQIAIRLNGVSLAQELTDRMWQNVLDLVKQKNKKFFLNLLKEIKGGKK